VSKNLHVCAYHLIWCKFNSGATGAHPLPVSPCKVKERLNIIIIDQKLIISPKVIWNSCQEKNGDPALPGHEA
jgi:hypothetical protein